MNDADPQRKVSSSAPGWPGIEPRWTRAAKDAVGTARSAASHVWYTSARGILTEVYWPTIDSPQIRDVQLLFTDGRTFFHDERRDLVSHAETIDADSLALRITSHEPQGRYSVVKEIIADPDQSAVLIRVHIEATEELRDDLQVFVLCAPHLGIGGWGNSAEVGSVGDRTVLLANRDDVWMALGASIRIKKASAGFVGVSDGWQDLADNFEMDWEYVRAEGGNVALVGELDVVCGHEFVVALTFSNRRHGAITALLQALGRSFAGLRNKFIQQWLRTTEPMLALETASSDEGALYRTSRTLLLSHEDKLYPGALIASLSIPWGESKGDVELGGYHLVWTRDLVNSAMGLLAAGNTDVPMHALIYLAAAQLPDGGFHQNFWVSGDPFWTGVQLDEVAFPILLAYHLHRSGALENFDPYDLVVRAAGYLVRHGPATPQERWEELSGYSPSTLASNIAALVCAATMCRERGDAATADFILDYADFLEAHVEEWTVTDRGSLVEDVSRHYVRIGPSGDRGDGDPNTGTVVLPNRPPGSQRSFRPDQIVDAGFLELVRYGIRRPDDPLIVDSLHVVDSVLKVEFEEGPSWYRYNHDGYGQNEHGGPFDGTGMGRPWPLLTGERGHYEFAAGNDPSPYLKALEAFAHGIGLLPEQVWDENDRPEQFLSRGRPTGAAMPLMWAHAEYIKLLRSSIDGAVFDMVPEVVHRYQKDRPQRRFEIWKPNRQPSSVPAGATLRIQSPEPFNLLWSLSEGQESSITSSIQTKLGVSYVDIRLPLEAVGRVHFTFGGEGVNRWEGKDKVVAID